MSTGALLLGLVNGLTIGLLGLGFVLVYKANRFLNLAHAQMGAVSAMLLAKFVNDWGWSVWLALTVTLPIGVVIGVAVEQLLVRPVRRRTNSPVRLLILTVGISQLLLALTFVSFLTPDVSGDTKPYPQPFHSDIQIGGVVLDGMSILTLLVVPALLLALSVFFGVSSVGRQIRAAASNPQAARLCGISIDRMSLLAWALAGGLSAVSAVLSGPTSSSFNLAAVGPNLLLFTMGAAAFGAFVSLPWAVAGGIVLGEVYQLVAAETLDSGTATLWTFAVILAVVLLRGRAISQVFAAAGPPVPERPAVRVPGSLRAHPVLRAPLRWLALGALAIACVFPLLPYFARDASRFLLVLLLIYALIGVSLTVLIGWGGQVSLGHFAIVGLGAYLTARWAADDWTVVGLLLVVGTLGAAVTALVGLPALRVRGLTLVVTTLGFAVVAPQWLFLQRRIGGDTPFTTPVRRPAVGTGLGNIDSNLRLYYVVLVTLAVTVAALSSLRRSGAGRTIFAVRDNERASAAFGVTPATVKLGVLALSGFIAAMAGVFWAIAWQRVTPAQLGPDASMAVLAVPVIGGVGSVGGALAATAVVYLPTLFLSQHLSGLFGEFGASIAFLLVLGGAGVVLSMRQFPNGIAGEVTATWQAYLDRRATSTVRTSPAPAVQRPPLEVRNVSVRFGGVAALAGAEIDVRHGEIVGLIGPNGAGKSTLMNVVSGVTRADAGSVQLFGHEVIDLPAGVRARYGLARSFQDATLFAGLTVLETVQFAASQRTKTGLVGSLVGAPWVRAHDRAARAEAEAIVASFGLEAWSDSLVIGLSTGTRRICDLAAQVAARPRLVMLDEPTAGVAQREAEAFGPLVRRIRDDLDCSMLIIEHDMPLLMAVCDRIYAMEAGRVIAEGTPAEIRANPTVISSYLGTDAVAVTRSGSIDSPRRSPRRRSAPIEAGGPRRTA